MYSVAILYRSIIEHYFKHLYIYTKALKDDNDNTGKIYYKTLKGSEDLQWLDKINKHNKKFGSNKMTWNTNDDHNKVIRKAKEEFRFSEILDYLKSDNDNKYIRTYLLEKSIEYDNLSSVIHGGPFGEQVFCNLQQDKNKFNDNLNKFATDSFELYCSTVKTTYLFASLMDEKLKEHYDKIREMLKFTK